MTGTGGVNDEEILKMLSDNSFVSEKFLEDLFREKLADIAQSPSIQRLIIEIKELKNLPNDWNGLEANKIDSLSINKCLNFVCQLAIRFPHGQTIPYVDPHPDGEVSLTWRNKDIGILNISFSRNDHLTYACIFLNGEKHKGKLHFVKEINSILLRLIDYFN